MSRRPAWLPEQALPTPSASDTVIFWAAVLSLLLISVVLVGVSAGWLWYQLGDTVERLFWSAMTRWF